MSNENEILNIIGYKPNYWYYYFKYCRLGKPTLFSNLQYFYNGEFYTIPLNYKSAFLIGSDNRCDIKLPVNDLSPFHAVLFYGINGSLYLLPLNNSNITYYSRSVVNIGQMYSKYYID